MIKISNLADLLKALVILLPIIATFAILCKGYILNSPMVKALRYRNRKLSKITSESFREKLRLLLKKYPDDESSLEDVKKHLISKKDHFDYLDIKKSNKFGNQKREMIASNIKILEKLIDLIAVIQPPSSIGTITSTENEINLLKKLVSSNSQGHSHLYAMIRLNEKFDNDDMNHEFLAIYRHYISDGKPFPLN